jgi:hypothetical protein
MKLSDLISKYKANIFNDFPDDSLVDTAESWKFDSSIKLNGIIAIGWLSNEDILVISVDGVFLYDTEKQEVVFEDLETSFTSFISSDNLSYYLESRNETVSIFGIRGGGGNLLSKHNKWSWEVLSLSWNVKIPRLLNYKDRKNYCIKLSQVSYEGNLYLGMSKSEKYCAIMGCDGVDIYKNFI